MSSTWNTVAGQGSITFNGPLDQTVPLDPDDWIRGLGSTRRQVTALNYASATVIQITATASAAAVALATGWQYTPGATPIKGTNGAEVAGFTGFTSA